MKERPILMSSPMVRAILSGAKTQTRRVIKCWQGDFDTDINMLLEVCPFGHRGDHLWVREAWCADCHDKETADCNTKLEDVVCYKATRETNPGSDACDKWHPSIFMPRWASRITLEITSVRVERLQDITLANIVKEGFDNANSNYTLSTEFRRLWDSINGKKYPWSSSPWVWVIEFKKC